MLKFEKKLYDPLSSSLPLEGGGFILKGFTLKGKGGGEILVTR